MQPQEGTALSSDQQAMSDLWDEHMRSEFETSSVEATLETMVEDPYVNHVPVMTGGVGLEEVRTFYAERFIPQQPPEVEITPVSRTVGNDPVGDELIYAFTHDIEVDWMMPGVPPTGKRIEVPMAVVVEFRDGKIASERSYPSAVPRAPEKSWTPLPCPSIV